MRNVVILAGLSTVLASPLALAEISLYGKVHMAIENASPEVGDSTTDLVSNDSRLGVEGATKINDSLEAIFQYEIGVDVDGNTDGDFLTQRNQYGGLKGGFGKLIAGIHDTPLKKLEGSIDLFGDTYADVGKVFDHYVDSQEREKQFLGYYSPKFGDFQFQIATMPGKYALSHGEKVDAEFGDAFSAALVYGDPKHKKSNYYFGIGYDEAVDGEDTSVARLAGSIKLGGFFLGTIIENADNGTDDHMRYAVSTYYQIGNGKLELQYANAEEIGSIKGSNQMTVGWEHKLGGGASAYIAYSQQELEEGDAADMDYASVGFIYSF